MGTRGAIIVGGHVNGLGLVRALAARNVPTAVVVTKPYDIAQWSRRVSATATVLELEEQPERLAELLERRAGEWSGWAVFPANDGALAALAPYHDRLASTYCIVAPPQEAVRCLLDKRLMLDVARVVGVDTPHCYGGAVAATAERSDVRFPVVVKPNVGYRFYSRFGCKLFMARDRAELQQGIARLVGAQMQGEVFDYVPGPDSQIYAYCTYLDTHGAPRGGLLVHKLRQSPPFFGVARVAEIVADNPAVRDATIEIARRIGVRGIAVAEFKLDPRDGRMRFIEINGRSVIYNALLRRAGLDLGGLAWADQVCGTPESAHPNGWPGVWLHVHADLLYTLLYQRHDRITLADFVAPYRRPKIDAVWSVTDPLPFVAEWSRSARAGAAAVWQGTPRKLSADRTRPPLTD